MFPNGSSHQESSSTPTHYEVLSLPQSLLDESSPSQVPLLLKRAYHRALLRHHPDKTQSNNSSHNSSNQRIDNAHPPSIYLAKKHVLISIDQITTAYTTLSDPISKSAYDRSLRLAPRHSAADLFSGGESAAVSSSSASSSSKLFQTGIEEVDLDDLSYDEVTGEYHRSCRCGNEKGYLFTEADLEEAASLAELMVGCLDCSLWLRVHFAVMEEEEEEES